MIYGTPNHTFGAGNFDPGNNLEYHVAAICPSRNNKESFFMVGAKIHDETLEHIPVLAYFLGEEEAAIQRRGEGFFFESSLKVEGQQPAFQFCDALEYFRVVTGLAIGDGGFDSLKVLLAFDPELTILKELQLNGNSQIGINPAGDYLNGKAAIYTNEEIYIGFSRTETKDVALLVSFSHEGNLKKAF